MILVRMPCRIGVILLRLQDCTCHVNRPAMTAHSCLSDMRYVRRIFRYVRSEWLFKCTCRLDALGDCTFCVAVGRHGQCGWRLSQEHSLQPGVSSVAQCGQHQPIAGRADGGAQQVSRTSPADGC